MRVLLTGANGFIGRYVLDALDNQNIDVITVGRSKPEHSNQFIQADLLASPDWSRLMKHADASHLLHLAWYVEHGQFWDSPLNLDWVNATCKMVEAFCTNGGKKVVISGTCAEYSWDYGVCKEESTPLQPASLYGSAKDATRRISHTLCNMHQTEFAWGRIFSVFGPGEPSDRLIPALISVFQGRRPPFPVNAQSLLDYLYVADVASALVALLEPQAKGDFNICSGSSLRVVDLINKISKKLNKPKDIFTSEHMNFDNGKKKLAGDNSRLKSLGWRKEFSFEQGILNTALNKSDFI